jgi:hypothetical protein
MAFASSTLQPVNNVTKPEIGIAENGAVASVLSAVVLSVYAGHKSRKQLRKLKRKMTWLLIKQKFSSLFSAQSISDRQLIIYILIGIIALVLLFTYPVAALVLAIVALILLLTGTI